MSAIISECGTYRYVLKRSLGSVLRWYRPMLFIMLNPSTADAKMDDPTIRRVMEFAKRARATHLTVVNLYALRSTDPAALKTHRDPVGPENDGYILEEVAKHKQLPIIAAWGANASKQRANNVIELIESIGGELHCLGKNKDGSPKHPLYLKADSEIIPLKGAQDAIRD